MITLAAPSSKSLSHRMLIGAALARGESVLRNVLDSEDIARTRQILCSAGADISPLPDGKLLVRGAAGKLAGGTENSPLSCYVHESGTTCRLLCAVLATGQGCFRIHGAARMHERPLGELARALETLGVPMHWERRLGYPPLVLEASGMQGGRLSMELTESSQYLSGLLLAAPLCRNGLDITFDAGKAVSLPYVSLTLQTLEEFGIAFQVMDEENCAVPDWRACMRKKNGMLRFTAPRASYKAGDFSVEGDWSGSSYFLAAGAVGAHAVRMTGLRADSLQGDRKLLDILRRMGACIEEGEGQVTVYPSRLRGIEIDMGACPDLVPTVAALAAYAEGGSRIRGASHLRIKESDRIAAPARNLRAAGITVREHDDGLSIEGGEPQAAPLFHAAGDHRIAMSAALLGLRRGAVILDNPAVVHKSFPDFWKSWEKILEHA